MFKMPGYKLYFAEDYQEEFSMFMVYQNHTYCDGMSWFGNLNALSENGFSNTVALSKEITLAQRVMIELMRPYMIAKFVWKLLVFYPFQNNVIRRETPKTKNLVYRMT